MAKVELEQLTRFLPEFIVVEATLTFDVNYPAGGELIDVGRHYYSVFGVIVQHVTGGWRAEIDGALFERRQFRVKLLGGTPGDMGRSDAEFPNGADAKGVVAKMAVLGRALPMG